MKFRVTPIEDFQHVSEEEFHASMCAVESFISDVEHLMHLRSNIELYHFTPQIKDYIRATMEGYELKLTSESVCMEGLLSDLGKKISKVITAVIEFFTNLINRIKEFIFGSKKTDQEIKEVEKSASTALASKPNTSSTSEETKESTEKSDDSKQDAETKESEPKMDPSVYEVIKKSQAAPISPELVKSFTAVKQVKLLEAPEAIPVEKAEQELKAEPEVSKRDKQAMALVTDLFKKCKLLNLVHTETLKVINQINAAKDECSAYIDKGTKSSKELNSMTDCVKFVEMMELIVGLISTTKLHQTEELEKAVAVEREKEFGLKDAEKRTVTDSDWLYYFSSGKVSVFKDRIYKLYSHVDQLNQKYMKIIRNVRAAYPASNI